jgi:dTDP-4-dehydrorhamnose 3,5-epimerase
MKVIKTKFPGLLIIQPDIFGDNRGWFIESYNKSKLNSQGIDVDFIQDNQSFSAKKGTIRGLHFQTGEMAQTKLVRCTKGALWDVCVDLRFGSPTYLMNFGIELSEENKTQFLIPKGFAHGFITLSDNVEISYKVDQHYSKEHDAGIRYDDKILNISWPKIVSEESLILSEKDLNLPNFVNNTYFHYNE